MNEHLLKCDPDQYVALADKSKTVEVRLADRDYQLGDWLRIRINDGDRWCLSAKVTHIVALAGMVVSPCERWWATDQAARYGVVAMSLGDVQMAEQSELDRLGPNR